MLKNLCSVMSVLYLLIIAGCNAKVKKGDAGIVDSNVKSGVVKIMNEVDSINNENEKQRLKMADTVVERINRMADSTRAVSNYKKKEIQKDIEQ